MPAQLLLSRFAQPVNEGERVVVEFLKEQLPANMWLAPNVAITQVSGTSQHDYEIDLIILTPHQVWVIEIKDWRGRVSFTNSRVTVDGHARGFNWEGLNTKAKVLKTLLEQQGADTHRLFVRPLVVLADVRTTSSLNTDGDYAQRVVHRAAAPNLLMSGEARLTLSPTELDTIRHALTRLVRPRQDARTRFDDYDVKSVLHTTASESTYLVTRADSPGKQFFLRVWLDDPYEDADERRRSEETFLREYKALQAIDANRHVVRHASPFRLNDDPHYRCAVTEWVEGQSLQDRLKAHDLDVRDRETITRGLLDGMNAVHIAGVLHRNFSPKAVRVRPDGSPVIVGFERAKLPGSQTISPATAVRSPSPYLAPELLDVNAQPTVASDCFALGRTLQAVWSGAPDQPVPALTPQPLRALITALTDPAPAKRLTDLTQAFWPVNIPTPSPRPTQPRPQAMEPHEFHAGDSIRSTYTVHDLLGRGGSGHVYKVSDAAGILYALKVYSRGFDAGSLPAEIEFVEWLHQQPPNPHLAAMHEWGWLNDGRLFLVTAFIDGDVLTRFTDPKRPDYQRLPRPEALSLVRQVVTTLRQLHAAGFLHRDVKPSNILRQPDLAILIDYDISARTERSHHTQVGTPGYTLPGAALQGWGPYADLFGAAVVLYELLTGHHPYLQRVLIAGAQPTDPRAYSPGLPRAIADFLLRAVSMDAALHFSDADAFVAALDAAENDAEAEQAADELESVFGVAPEVSRSAPSATADPVTETDQLTKGPPDSGPPTSNEEFTDSATDPAPLAASNRPFVRAHTPSTNPIPKPEEPPSEHTSQASNPTLSSDSSRVELLPPTPPASASMWPPAHSIHPSAETLREANDLLLAMALALHDWSMTTREPDWVAVFAPHSRPLMTTFGLRPPPTGPDAFNKAAAAAVRQPPAESARWPGIVAGEIRRSFQVATAEQTPEFMLDWLGQSAFRQPKLLARLHASLSADLRQRAPGIGWLPALPPLHPALWWGLVVLAGDSMLRKKSQAVRDAAPDAGRRFPWQRPTAPEPTSDWPGQADEGLAHLVEFAHGAALGPAAPPWASFWEQWVIAQSWANGRAARPFSAPARQMLASMPLLPMIVKGAPPRVDNGAMFTNLVPADWLAHAPDWFAPLQAQGWLTSP